MHPNILATKLFKWILNMLTLQAPSCLN